MSKIMNFVKRIIKKPSDKGSALVSVLVIVSFISILATVMLYMSGENYKMKIADQKTKGSFYEAEEIVELMKTQLAKDVANASQPAFADAAVYYVEGHEESIRAQKYFEAFKTNFRKIYRDHWYSVVPGVGESLDLAKGIGELFPGATSISADKSSLSASFNITMNGTELHCTLSNFSFDDSFVPSTSIFDASGDVSKHYVFGTGTNVDDSQTFILTVSDNNGSNVKRYTSVLRTSFEITPPILNWGTDVKNSDDKLDYLGCVAYFRWTKD